MEIKSVDLFEAMFGHIATQKYLCGKKVRSYPSMETIPGTRIAMSETDRTFESMILTYDSTNERCKFEFKHAVQPFNELVGYLDGRRECFQEFSIDPFINNQVSNEVPLNNRQTPVYGSTTIGLNRAFTTGRQQRLESNNTKINDISVLERAIVGKTRKAAISWDSNLKWMVKQLATDAYSHRTIYDGVLSCSRDYISNIDEILNDMLIPFDAGMKPLRKKDLFAKTLQSWYDEAMNE
jgi:hypothetical protein